MSVPRPPLSRQVQVRILGSLLGECPVQRGDTWEYAVSDAWLGKLKTAFNDFHKADVAVLPMTCSFNDGDNTFLGESIWKVLVSWYGLADDYELHRRPTFSKYIQIPEAGETYIHTDKSLDFVHVPMCLLDHLDCVDKQLYQQVYMWEDFKFIELQLRRALGITMDRSLRMWMSVKKGDEDVFMGILNLQEMHASTSFGSFLCSKIPSLLQIIQNRQELSPATTALESLTSSSFKSHLSETLQSLGINVMLGAEETGGQDNSTTGQTLSCLSGINSGLIVSRQQLDWSRSIDEVLDTFEKDVQFSVHTKRDEISTKVNKIIKDKLESAEKIVRDVDIAKADLKDREMRFKEREKDLDEREHDLNMKVDKFKRGLTDYLLQKKRLETELQKIEEQNKFSDTKVELNVGGVKYTTSTITLTKDSDSLLTMMFSGRHNIQKEADGSYFIDRDGTNFRHILNYLRDGPRAADALNGQPSLLSEVLVEADYFKLTKLANAIRDKLDGSKSGPYASLPARH